MLLSSGHTSSSTFVFSPLNRRTDRIISLSLSLSFVHPVIETRQTSAFWIDAKLIFDELTFVPLRKAKQAYAIAPIKHRSLSCTHASKFIRGLDRTRNGGKHCSGGMTVSLFSDKSKNSNDRVMMQSTTTTRTNFSRNHNRRERGRKENADFYYSWEMSPSDLIETLTLLTNRSVHKSQRSLEIKPYSTFHSRLGEFYDAATYLP